MFGHKNTISYVIGNKYICDGCSRCGITLPIAYPYHEDYKKLRQSQ